MPPVPYSPALPSAPPSAPPSLPYPAAPPSAPPSVWCGSPAAPPSAGPCVVMSSSIVIACLLVETAPSGGRALENVPEPPPLNRACRSRLGVAARRLEGTCRAARGQYVVRLGMISQSTR